MSSPPSTLNPRRRRLIKTCASSRREVLEPCLLEAGLGSYTREGESGRAVCSGKGIFPRSRLRSEFEYGSTTAQGAALAAAQVNDSQRGRAYPDLCPAARPLGKLHSPQAHATNQPGTMDRGIQPSASIRSLLQSQPDLVKVISAIVIH